MIFKLNPCLLKGGTFLGSSRGGFDLEKICNFLKKHEISQLYVIGGDGTHRGAFQIHLGCMERVSEMISETSGFISAYLIRLFSVANECRCCRNTQNY